MHNRFLLVTTALMASLAANSARADSGDLPNFMDITSPNYQDPNSYEYKQVTDNFTPANKGKVSFIKEFYNNKPDNVAPDNAYITFQDGNTVTNGKKTKITNTIFLVQSQKALSTNDSNLQLPTSHNTAVIAQTSKTGITNIAGMVQVGTDNIGYIEQGDASKASIASTSQFGSKNVALIAQDSNKKQKLKFDENGVRYSDGGAYIIQGASSKTALGSVIPNINIGEDYAGGNSYKNFAYIDQTGVSGSKEIIKQGGNLVTAAADSPDYPLPGNNSATISSINIAGTAGLVASSIEQDGDLNYASITNTNVKQTAAADNLEDLDGKKIQGASIHQTGALNYANMQSIKDATNSTAQITQISKKEGYGRGGLKGNLATLNEQKGANNVILYSQNLSVNDPVTEGRNEVTIKQTGNNNVIGQVLKINGNRSAVSGKFSVNGSSNVQHITQEGTGNQLAAGAIAAGAINGSKNTVDTIQKGTGNFISAYIVGNNNNLNGTSTTYQDVNQDGKKNTLITVINGDNNTLTTNQQGTGNEIGSANITGNNNKLKILTDGNSNTVTANIRGDTNKLTSNQLGTSNSITANIRGDTNKLTSNQLGTSNSITANADGHDNQYQNVTQDGTKNTLTGNITGAGNIFNSNQRQVGNYASATATGDTNRYDIVQDGTKNTLTSTITGNKNSLTFNQQKTGNYINSNVTGDNNKLKITTDGNSNTVTANIRGNNNGFASIARDPLESDPTVAGYYNQILLIGNNNAAGLNQYGPTGSGAGNVADIIVKGDKNTFIVTQGTQEASVSGNLAVAHVVGSKNDVTINQFGNNQKVLLEYTGSNNKITYNQSADAVGDVIQRIGITTDNQIGKKEIIINH